MRQALLNSQIAIVQIKVSKVFKKMMLEPMAA
jgi:hypothetical protein